MISKLFPQLSHYRWKQLNLNHLALRDFSGVADNPLLDAQSCLQWIQKIHEEHDIDASLGGYCENRSYLWRGSYLKEFLHLGEDYNVPAGTAVHVVHDGQVVGILDDLDQDGGWGGRVIIEHEKKPSLIYAHLRFSSISVQMRDKVKAGQVLGSVGESTENGGWYPHLHMQAFNEHIPIDGYGTEANAYGNWASLEPTKIFGG